MSTTPNDASRVVKKTMKPLRDGLATSNVLFDNHHAN